MIVIVYTPDGVGKIFTTTLMTMNGIAKRVESAVALRGI